MKSIVFILLAFVFENVSMAQDYDFVNKLNRHVSIVSKDDFYGMTYDKKLVLPLIYHGIDQMYNGYFIYKDSLSGFTDSKGKIIIPLDIYSVEPVDDRLIQVFRNGNETALYDYKGKLIIPFDVQEIMVFEEAILVAKGKQGLFALDGSVIIPFEDQQINIMDDYGHIVAVQKGNKNQVRINNDMEILDGFVPVNSELFTKTTEVSIEDYFAFVAHQKMNSYLTTEGDYMEIPYTELLPDTNFVEAKLRPIYRNLFRELAKDEGFSTYETFLGSGKYGIDIEIPFSKNKAQMKMFDFPVTGISKAQAENYARWLTMLAVEGLAYNDYGYVPKYRLPTENEWIQLAESGLKEEMKGKHVLDSLNAENCMLYIFNNLPKCKGFENYIKASLGGGSVPVLSMNPDLNGAYQYFGNVAEMVQEKNIAKGGSYNHGAQKALTSVQLKYDSPQPWLGFRLVAELVME